MTQSVWGGGVGRVENTVGLVSKGRITQVYVLFKGVANRR